MPFIVKDACIKCKHMDCVEVCPVDCFHEGENMLVISDVCIDCGVCIPECPVDAITEGFNDDPDGKWLAINKKYSELWPQITKIGDVPVDAAKYESETGKFEKYFSEAPGKGDE